MHVYYKMLIYKYVCIFYVYLAFIHTQIYIYLMSFSILMFRIFISFYTEYILLSYIYYLLHLSSASAFTNAFNSSIVPSVKPNSTIPLLIIFKRTLQIPVDSTRVTSRLSLCPTNLES